MPRFTMPGADEVSCADVYGRAYRFVFPYKTDVEEEIALLRKLGATEEAPAKIAAVPPQVDVVPAEEKAEKSKTGGDA